MTLSPERRQSRRSLAHNPGLSCNFQASGLLFMFGIGAILGPFIASAMMTLTSFSGLYVFTGAVHLLLVVYVTYRIFRRTSAPTEQHIAFTDALATAHTASQVYDEEIQHLAEDEI